MCVCACVSVCMCVCVCVLSIHMLHGVSCPQSTTVPQLAHKLSPIIARVGQNCIHTPHMTVFLVISLPKIPYIHRIYMVLANPNNSQILHLQR